MRRVVWAHIAGLAAYAYFVTGLPLEDAAAVGAIPAIPVLMTFLPHRTRRFRETAACVAVILAAGAVFHLGHGTAVANLYLVAMIGVLAAYRSWAPFGFALLAILVHDAVLARTLPDPVLILDLPLLEHWRPALLLGGVVGLAVGLFTVSIVSERQRSRIEAYYLKHGRVALAHQLQEAERFREELLAIVSHELRTPLAAIKGFTRTLVDRDEAIPPAMRADFHDRILRNSDRLDRVVRNLLETGGTWQMEPDATTNVSDVVRATVRDLEHSRSSDLEFKFVRIVGDHTDAAVRMSSEALALVVSNLVDNAMKFALPHSEVIVSVRSDDGARTSDGTRGAIEVRVSNDADPIAPVDRQRMFEPFVQLDSSAKRTHPGVGLGLYVVKRVVEAHGGTIRLDCGPSIVTVKVTLPRVDEEARGLTEHEAREDGIGPSPSDELAISCPDPDTVPASTPS